MVLLGAAFVIWDQMHWWETVADYSFGYLVPLLFFYILWTRRSAIAGYCTPDTAAEVSKEPNTLGARFLEKLVPLTGTIETLAFCSAILGLILFGMGALVRAALGPLPEASLLISSGFGIGVLSSVFLASDRGTENRPLPLNRRLSLTLLFLFPALIWIITAPMIEGVERRISLFLLDKVTVIVFSIVEALGFALVREGNVLYLPKGEVGVAEACSGIRSLTACLFTGSFLGAAFLDKLWKKGLLVFLAMGLAFATNILRSFFLTIWAYQYGSEALEHTLWGISIHDLTGYSVLIITSLGLFALLPIFDLFDDLEEES